MSLRTTRPTGSASWALIVAFLATSQLGCSDDSATSATNADASLPSEDTEQGSTQPEDTNDDVDGDPSPPQEPDERETDDAVPAPDTGEDDPADEDPAAPSSTDATDGASLGPDAAPALSSGDAGTQPGPEVGDVDGATPAPPCHSLVQLETGENYADYTLYAIRLEQGIEPGAYLLRTEPGRVGSVILSRGDEQLGEFEYDAHASLEDNARQTVIIAGYFELDIGSAVAPDLRGLPEAMFDGCHTLVVSDVHVVEEGGVYGSFVITTLTIAEQAPSGTYTFHTESGNAGSVVVQRDGVVVDQLEYSWMTTVGGGESYVFEFPGLVSFEVTRNMGTSNLFGLAEVLFDGRTELRVP